MSDDAKDDVAAILTARDQTFAAGTASITWSTDYSWSLPPRPDRDDRGPILGTALGLGRTAGKVVGKALLRAVTRGVDPRQLRGEGIVDLAGRRYMADFGSYAVLQVGAQQWSGRSGRPLVTLPVDSPRVASPLWLFDLLAGVTTAGDRRTEQVDGQEWVHLGATASLAEASGRRPEGMPSLATPRFEELLHLPIDVWLDDRHVRRLRFTSEQQTDTVTLTAFPAPAEGQDWSRLPTFRSG